MNARRVVFNVSALEKAASAAVGANKVLSIKKFRESLTRDFHCVFDNGKEAVVRIPTPLAGPPHLTTASEVATMDFLRRLHLPVPRVLAWNSRAHSSEVGVEYIVMETGQGGGPVFDEKAWEEVEDKLGEATSPFIQALSDTLRPLADLRFKYHGSIYYKADVPSGMKSYGDFLLDGAPSGVDLSPFVVGPSVHREFWEGDRATLAIDRGPWTSALDNLQAIVAREQRWLEGGFAKPSLDDHYLCVLPTQKVEDHLRTLDHYKTILPCITPTDGVLDSGRLWHPNLRLEDVSFKVAPDSSSVEILSLTNWTGAIVGPSFVNVKVPPFLYHPQAAFPGNRDELAQPLNDGMSAEEVEKAKQLNLKVAMHRLFEDVTYPGMVGVPIRDYAATSALRTMGSTWKAGLINARYFLSQMTIVDWPTYSPNPCPVKLSPSEIKLAMTTISYYSEEIAFWMAISIECEVDEQGFFDFHNGLRDTAKFERTKAWLVDAEKDFVAAVPGDERKRAFLWPYRESMQDHPRSHLVDF
ncbi:hypothetical protein EUX98_g5841 [Antrodiella citrinella]|uniref:Altered inheritance of mitochondria protein 9, mitochondrial n=1 Tax=Antrodiella citrinella TaxID=2447956 RepID=A0A4S4MQL3_9APHY|nr:hypothetical protein EUX98_g5841 [Antrodiella citrinella]